MNAGRNQFCRRCKANGDGLCEVQVLRQSARELLTARLRSDPNNAEQHQADYQEQLGHAAKVKRDNGCPKSFRS